MSNWLYLDYLLSSIAGWSLFVGLLATILRLNKNRALMWGGAAYLAASLLVFLWLPLVPHQAFFPLVWGAVLGIWIGTSWAREAPQGRR